MSGGTAGDGKDAKDEAARVEAARVEAAKAETAEHEAAEHEAVGHEAVTGDAVAPAQARVPDVAAPAAGVAKGGAPSEWTVSDHRGPLRAPTEGDRTADEGERFVPGSEVDAEGASDAPAAGFASAIERPAVAPARAEAPAARRSSWPIAAGIVVGSLFGAGSAAVVYNLQQGGSPPASETSGKLADLATRVVALEKRPDPQGAIGDVRNEVHALSGRVAALEKRPAAAPPPEAKPSEKPVDAKSADAKPADTKPSDTKPTETRPAAPPAPVASTPAAPNGELAAKVAALQAALDAMGRQDGSRQAANQAAVKDLAGKLDALQGSLAKVQEATRSSADAEKGQRQDLDGKLAALQGAVSAAQKQAGAVQGDLSALQGGLASVQGEQKALTAKVGAPALAVAADSLVAQVEAGKPYRAQVDALASLGADPARVAVLRENAGAGVPSAQALAASFAPLADPVIATGNRAPANAGLGEQLKHGLFGLVDVRRADDTAGDGLASRVALLQADLAHNDVGGAYAVWSALPAEAKAKSASFGAQLKTSAEALAAARGLQAQSIDSLTAKKS